jgi:translation elongation factor EF-Tu-like GTPase
MKRGRPFEPGNKLGRGRPKGSPNKKKPLAQKILDENAPAIMALAINTAREDDKMLRTLIRELGRRMGDRPVKLGRMPMNTLTDLDQASATILGKVTAGKISISEGVAVCGMIELRRQVLTGVELETRVSNLEAGQTRQEAA